jgi:hypothetical protein
MKILVTGSVDVKDVVEQFDYKPSSSIETGISNFISWYQENNKIGSTEYKVKSGI